MSPFTSAILLAGGNGTRMNNTIPKQYLPLGNKLIVRYSFDLFAAMAEIHEIIVICTADRIHEFSEVPVDKPVKFALPGPRRQDSVYNGLALVAPEAILISVHDAARPLLTKEIVLRTIQAAHEHGAAAAAMPLSFTVKQTTPDLFVSLTLDRNNLWEIQTPQTLRRTLLEEGLHYALAHQLTVTDCSSLIEKLGHPVKLVEGGAFNLKITTPTDLAIAHTLLKSRE